MLWHVLWKNKNTFSLTFTLTFSIVGIIWQKNPFSAGLGAIGKLADRLSGAMNASLEFPEVLWVELDRYRDLEKKYDSALKQLEAYKLEKDRFDRLVDENEKLRHQLHYDPLPRYPEIPAEVIGIRINSISPRIIINRGKRDGLAPFMPVIVQTYDLKGNLIRAVVGMVAHTDHSTSIVQPVNHPSFRLGVRVSDSRYWAILNGNSGNFNEVLLTYIAENSIPGLVAHSDSMVQIAAGQDVVTSGAGGIFPEGIPVGAIMRLGPENEKFKTAYVKTYASLSRLDNVLIIKKHPEKWAENSDRKISWEENLKTEFGEATFPEPEKKSAPPTKPVRTSESRESEVTGPQTDNSRENQSTSETKTGSDKKTTSPASPREETPAAEEAPVEPPRRINNVNVPVPGGL